MKKRIFFLIIILIMILIPCFLFMSADNYFGERTDAYLEQAVTYAASDIFSDAAVVVAENSNENNLISFVKDDNNNITSCYVNTKEANYILAAVSNVLSDAIRSDSINNRLDSVKVPIGQLISKSIFASVGPKVDIRVDPIFSYQTDILTSCKEYGINNTQIEVYVYVKIQVEAFIPLKQTTFWLDSKIYLISQVLQGNVPLFYNGS